MKKEFNLMEVLSAISGYSLIEKFDRLHELIEWVMGSAVFTHQIPSVANVVKKRLLQQFPQLNNLDATIENLSKHIKRKELSAEISIKSELRKTFGDSFHVTKG